jgi:dTDP-4-amino-4,6-dideoxygalactose transaminase
MYYSHNFGHNGPLDFFGLGINGKISELQAAMGLCVFESINYVLSERKKAVEYYNSNLNLSIIRTIKIRENTVWNYSYYPIIFESEEKLLQKLIEFNKQQIFPRRYFYPSLNTINYCNGDRMVISESIASRILCLPLYLGLIEEDLIKICNIINH